MTLPVDDHLETSSDVQGEHSTENASERATVLNCNYQSRHLKCNYKEMKCFKMED